MAEYAKSQGFHTFHSGLVTFSADTLGKTPDEGLDLTVRCAPWEYNPNSGLSLSGAAEGGLRKHPRVRVGEVTWNGGRPGEESRPGGLRKEAWAHVVTLEPGEVYSPAPMRANYGRLSRLRVGRSGHSCDKFALGHHGRGGGSGASGQAVMDVDFIVTQKSSHDLGVELDLVRNDARYGPKIGVTLLHRNPRGWGAENAWDVGFGYVAVAPFSTFTTANVLNSGEWTLRWSTTQLGVVPLPLRWFKASTEPSTRWDVGWDREIWPEFTRSQIHLTEDIHLTENPQRQSQMSFSPMDVSFVNLTNIDPSFQQWLSDQNNPLVEARFNNHLDVGVVGWMGQPLVGPIMERKGVCPLQLGGHAGSALGQPMGGADGVGRGHGCMADLRWRALGSTPTNRGEWDCPVRGGTCTPLCPSSQRAHRIRQCWKEHTLASAGTSLFQWRGEWHSRMAASHPRARKCCINGRQLGDHRGRRCPRGPPIGMATPR